MDAQDFLESIVQFGLEYFHIYPGVYRAVVMSNEDPQGRGRIQIRCPAVGHQTTVQKWVAPATASAGPGRGVFWAPEIGDAVWVSFSLGNASKPNVYWGGWWGYVDQASEVPTEFAYDSNIPEKRGFVTRAGHRIVFNDKSGEESLEIVWHQPSESDTDYANDRTKSADRAAGKTSSIKLTSDGSIEATDSEGQFAKLEAPAKKITIGDANGNSIILSSEGIEAKSSSVKMGEGADQAAVRGDDWFQWTVGHIHGTAMGPSGPPIEPPPRTILSTVVKVK